MFTLVKPRPTLRQLMHVRRLSRGEFRDIEDTRTHPAVVSAQRWDVALQMSRILRAQRRRVRHGH
jgi:hypothetical protein